MKQRQRRFNLNEIVMNALLMHGNNMGVAWQRRGGMAAGASIIASQRAAAASGKMAMAVGKSKRLRVKKNGKWKSSVARHGISVSASDSIRKYRQIMADGMAAGIGGIIESGIK